jgi:hypothetical protein
MQTHAKMSLDFEKLETSGIDFGHAVRAKVPGGWLVYVHGNALGQSHGGMTFYPDPEHAWNGSSL